MPDTVPPEFRPRLRPGLAAAPTRQTGVVAVHDGNRIVPGFVTVDQRVIPLLNSFDGRKSVREHHAASGLALADLCDLVGALDAALLLDSPAFHGYLTGPVRKPSCIGCYPDDPAGIREQLDGLFTAPGGPGLPAAAAPGADRLRAVLVPHMDYARGGVTYGHGFKALAERTDARLFVVVATSHYSPERFTLTRMNFATPLGVAQTDQKYIDSLVEHYGDGLFDDPVAHLPEHSVELEVVLLQHLFGPAVRVVPLLVGSFADRVRRNAAPGGAADVARMAAALRAAEAAAGEPVCYVISGDLAHIGPKFDDPDPVGEPWLTESRAADEQLLDRLAAADADGYFRAIAKERDARRICGLPPTWLTLAATQPRRGEVLHYGRYVHPAGHESVSFAAAAFYA